VHRKQRQAQQGTRGDHAEAASRAGGQGRAVNSGRLRGAGEEDKKEAVVTVQCILLVLLLGRCYVLPPLLWAAQTLTAPAVAAASVEHCPLLASPFHATAPISQTHQAP
jgi:hypothetical protein